MTNIRLYYVLFNQVHTWKYPKIFWHMFINSYLSTQDNIMINYNLLFLFWHLFFYETTCHINNISSSNTFKFNCNQKTKVIVENFIEIIVGIFLKTGLLKWNPVSSILKMLLHKWNTAYERNTVYIKYFTYFHL